VLAGGRDAPAEFKEMPVLVLSRREGQAVVIPGCRVEIVIKQIAGDTVRLGFLAPNEVDIYRDEIWRDMCFEDWNQRSHDNGTED
jgi:carbon storage regulator